MNPRAFSKIWIIIIFIVLITGGIFAWQYFGTQEKPKIISFEVIPSQKTEGGIVYEDGAKAVVIGENLARVEFRQRGGGQIYTNPEGGLVGIGVRTETQGGKQKWEVLLPSERLMKEFCALGFNAGGEKIGEVCLFNVYGAAKQQTYRNEEFGFEIKYPSFFSVVENPSTEILLNPITGVLVKFSKLNDLDYPDILIHLRKTNLTPTEWMNNSLCQPSPSGNTLCTPPKPGPISGSIQVQSQGTHFNSANTFFKHNDILFDISLNEKRAVPIPKDEFDVYNQMLSTFKFLK